MKSLVQNSDKVTDRDLKKAGGYKGRKIVNITIKIKIVVLMIKHIIMCKKLGECNASYYY